MLPIAHVGITPAQLRADVVGTRWSSWCRAEPDLKLVDSLAQLRGLRGREEDPPLGALLRLAATDGGNDQLAAVAIVHHLQPAVQKFVCEFRNLAGADVDGVVVGALWAEIRGFPWRTRRRGYAAGLIHDTRKAILSLLMPGRDRTGVNRVDSFDPQRDFFAALVERSAGNGHDDPFGPETDLADFLRWAIRRQVVTRQDARLLLELVDADRRNRSLASPGWSRGPCSVVAVATVANSRGVCGRTVVRSRDDVIARLRAAAPLYLTEAA